MPGCVTTHASSALRSRFHSLLQPALAGLLAHRPRLQRWCNGPSTRANPGFCLDSQPISTGFFMWASAAHYASFGLLGSNRLKADLR